MRDRTAAVLLLAVAWLTTLGWTDESSAQSKISRVGILATPPMGTSRDVVLQWYEPFHRALAGRGWIEGKNVLFEYRSASGAPPRFSEAAVELARLGVDVIYADNAPAARAAYEATRTIPIVALDFTNDPVAVGYANSYSRPGGNLTGVFLDAPEFAGKWLELLRALVPGLSHFAVLWDPNPGPTHLRALQAAARSLEVQLQVVEVHKPDELERAFSSFRAQAQALIILPSPMTWGQSARLAALAMKRRLPATSMAPLFADAGGAVSYGPNAYSALEQAANLVAEILGGAKPADLPVERPTKFQLIINLKTAKELGLTVPDSVLVSADKVIR